jgi:hypothetical protein
MLQMMGAIDFPEAKVYLDDESDLKFYVLPKFPTMLRDGDKAAFKFIKYRTPKPLPNGDIGAALVFMDIALMLTEQEDGAVRQRLADFVHSRRGQGSPPVDPKTLLISRPEFITGSVTVEVLAASGALVQRVNHAGHPSMYGDNIVAMSAELTQFGAPVFEAAMKTDGAGGVRVEYDLTFAARMPPIKAIGIWHASRFYSFVQEVDFEENFWTEDDFNEKVTETFTNSESRFVEIDPGGALPNDPEAQKAKDMVRDAVTRQLDEAVKRNLIDAIPPELRDFSKIRDADFENIKRSVTTNKSADVRIEVKENQNTSVHVFPQKNILSLTSQGFKWEDYAQEVDVEDPFFDMFVLPIQVNAEFDVLPIFSVDVSINYAPNPIETFTFRAANDLHKFERFRDKRPSAFKYRYVVHYKGEARTLDSGWKDGEGTDLKIDIDELGLWMVDIEIGDMNFDQVNGAVLTLEHPEVAPGVPPVATFQIDKDTKGLSIKEVLLAPVQPYGGSIKYFMKDGREFVRKLQDLKGQRFSVDDPFSATKVIQLRSRGDFERRIESIFVDFTYVEEANGFRQTPSAVINKENRFMDLSFPAIDETVGKLTYQAITAFIDGSTSDSGIVPVEGRTLILGEKAVTLSVTLVPDLIDWDKVKLATVEIHYDDEHGINERETYTFRKGASERIFELAIRDETKKSYTWSAIFFMADGSKKDSKSAGLVESETIVIEVPAG